MATVEGTVEAISNKFGKWSILVNGTWYGTKEEWKPKVDVNKGDVVSFDDGSIYGGGKFVKRLRVDVHGGSSSSTPHTTSDSPARPSLVGAIPLVRERAIIRQNALTNAVNYVNALPATSRKDLGLNDLIDIAREFEAYTSGDVDEEEAKEMLASEEV